MPLQNVVARFTRRTGMEDLAAPEAPTDDLEGRGWYVSSYDLRRGLDVIEWHDAAAFERLSRRMEPPLQA